MKRCTVLLLCLTLISTIFAPFTGAQEITPQQLELTPQPSRAIHVVYDDSGSMIYEDEIDEKTGKPTGKPIYVDRWVQVKYAMEVFAAMLDEKDTLRVFYMSDFDTKLDDKTGKPRGRVDAPAGITLYGNDSAQSRVDKVHDKVTAAWNTPYDAVAKAYKDLKETTADEKWLVLLTDGDFNQFDGDYEQIDGTPFKKKNPDGTEQDNPAAVKKVEKKVNDYFKQYVKDGDVKIIILAMGNIINIEFKKDGDRIIYERARNSDDILDKITNICNIIFKRIQYPNDLMINNRELDFDLRMEEFLVFAQGKNVQDVKTEGDKVTINPDEKVRVQYSEEAATNLEYPNNSGVKEIILGLGGNLTGVVARFRNIPEGKYNLVITEKETEKAVYIKPHINLQIKMYRDRDNVEIPINESKNRYFDDINADTYRIEYGIIDKNGNIFEPKTLKGIKLIPEVQINGKKIPIDEKTGTVKLTKGEAKILVQVRYKDVKLAEEPITGKILDERTFWERLKDWASRNRVILTWLFCILLALLLIWFFWGPPKKKFPKNMAPNPVIKIKKGDDDVPNRQGEFKKRKTITPMVAEEGTIIFVPKNRLPPLEVKAKDKRTMFLMNASSFTPDKRRSIGVKITIGAQPIKEGTKDNMVIRCTDTITTYFPANDIDLETTYKCFLAESRK
jgi:hypothetical protein